MIFGRGSCPCTGGARACVCPVLLRSLPTGILPELSLPTPGVAAFIELEPGNKEEGDEWRAAKLLPPVPVCAITCLPQHPVLGTLLPAAVPPLEAAMMRTDFSEPTPDTALGLYLHTSRSHTHICHIHILYIIWCVCDTIYI